MHSTQTLRETDDPHDAPAMAPDVVSAAWADKVLADINRAAKVANHVLSQAPDQLPRTPSTALAAPAPAVDTTFRAAAVGDIKPVKPPAARPPKSKWVAHVSMIFMFALLSAFAASLWKHYGATARQLIAEWTPPAVAEWAPQFTLASSSEQAAPVEQAAATADQTAAADQRASQAAGAAQPADAAAIPSESADLIQSMSRDLAAMGQQIEQLKASIAELKANQQPATPAIARTTEAKPAEIRPPPPVARPKMSATVPPPPAPRPVAPPLRRPPPVQASAAPMQLNAPPPPPPYAPQATARPVDDEPVVRPPMPLRWGTVSE